MAKTSVFKWQPWDKVLLEQSLENIAYWAKGYFDLDLFPWQQYFFHHPARDKMGIAGIRTGKSFVTAIAALYFAQTHPSSQYLNASISTEQAKIVYRTVLGLCEKPRFRHWVEHVEKSPYAVITLVNGAQMHFRSIGYQAELLRGYEYDFISLDECSYIPDEITIRALQGRLLGVNPVTRQPRAGWFWQLSSPKGKGTWVYDRWKRGDPQFPGADPQRYLSLRIRTSDNPLLSQEQLAALMADYTEAQVAQELEGQFLDDDGVLFRYADILNGCNEAHPEVRWLLDSLDALKGKQVDTGDLLQYTIPPQVGHKYLNVWDLGKRTTESGRNASVGMVWDITAPPWTLVGWHYAPNTPYLTTCQYIADWHRIYSTRSGLPCITATDSTGVGDVVEEVLTTEYGIQVRGIILSASTKPDILTSGKLTLERGRARYPFIKRFVDQLQIYQKDDKNLPQDTVMTFCMAMHLAHTITGLKLARADAPYDPTLLTNQSTDSLAPFRRQSLPNRRYVLRRSLQHGPATRRADRLR